MVFKFKGVAKPEIKDYDKIAIISQFKPGTKSNKKCSIILRAIVLLITFLVLIGIIVYLCERFKSYDESSVSNRLSNSSQEADKGHHYGCFGDREVRDLPDLTYLPDTLSPTVCMDLCLSKGYAFAGLQASNWCTCGDSYGRYGQAGNCGLACSGDPDSSCGGEWANDVYRTGAQESMKQKVIKQDTSNIERQYDDIETPILESRDINALAKDKTGGHWGEWGELSPCSVTCGSGTTKKVRLWIPGPDEVATQKEPFTFTQMFTCSGQAECPEILSDGTRETKKEINRWRKWYVSQDQQEACMQQMNACNEGMSSAQGLLPQQVGSPPKSEIIQAYCGALTEAKSCFTKLVEMCPALQSVMAATMNSFDSPQMAAMCPGSSAEGARMGGAGGPCKTDWTFYKRACYKLYVYGVRWHTAKSNCQKEGAELALPRSIEDNMFLGNLVEAAGVSTLYHVWINANDDVSEGAWVDGDNAALSWTNWIPGQGNVGPGNNYAIIDKGFGYRWADGENDWIKSYICTKAASVEDGNEAESKANTITNEKKPAGGWVDGDGSPLTWTNWAPGRGGQALNCLLNIKSDYKEINLAGEEAI